MRILMIDLETLSTSPTAAILSIGACVFDEDGPTATMDDTFLVSVHADYYAMQSAFDVNPKTEAWWATQGRAAQDSLKINRVSTLPIAMDAFMEWIGKQEYDLVMAKPAHFDMPILSNAALHAYGDSDAFPWKHWEVRCLRTICMIFSKEAKAASKVAHPELVHHRADHDALRQAIDYQYIRKYPDDS